MSEIWVIISLEIRLSHIRLRKILQLCITMYFYKCCSPSRRGATSCTQGCTGVFKLMYMHLINNKHLLH